MSTDKPYPIYKKGVSEDDFRRSVYEWMGSSVDICLIEANQSWNVVNIAQLWEPCAFACMLTVQGYEVMVGTSHRIGPNADIMLATTQSMGHQPIHVSQEQVYVEFSRMLTQSKDRHEQGTGERPPIREKTFREEHEDFINQMGLDDL